MEKLRIQSIEEKKKSDGNPFWVIRDENGKAYYCFDTKASELQEGDIIEVEIEEREGKDSKGNPTKWYSIKFPKEEKVVQETQLSVRGNIPQHDVIYSNVAILELAVDLEIALIQQGDKKSTKQALEEVKSIYSTFKGLVEGKRVGE
jgi:hypothetical protein